MKNIGRLLELSFGNEVLESLYGLELNVDLKIVGKSGSSHLRKIQRFQRIFELKPYKIDEHTFTLAEIIYRPINMPLLSNKFITNSLST